MRTSAVGLSDVFHSVDATNTLIGLNHKLLADGASAVTAATTTANRRNSVGTSNAREYQSVTNAVPFTAAGSNSTSGATSTTATTTSAAAAASLPTVTNVSAKSENAFTTLQQELEALNRLSTNAAKGLAAYT